MTDPDEFFEHFLFHAEPGRGAVAPGPAGQWSAWWQVQAQRLRADTPALGDVALAQGFALTTAQLRDHGVPRHIVRRRVRRGEWRALQRGVITVLGNGALADPNPRLVARRSHALDCAAAVTVNPGHVVTGRSAAMLHGLPMMDVPDGPELSVPTPQATRRRGARAAGMPAGDTSAWFGIATTSVPRTVVDLARDDRRDGLMAADAALRERLASADDLDRVLARMARWCGVAQAREVLALADPLAESPLESIVRLALHDEGFPDPQLQVEIAVPGQRNPYRVDFLWPQQRLILEADGREKYTGDALWREKRRETRLRALGYRIERVTWADVVGTWDDTRYWLAVALGC